MTGPAEPKLSRLVGLDVLRAVAVLLVLGHHPPTGRPSSDEPSALFLWWHVGWIGVDLFFVLSGFLIGGLLFEEAKKTGDICLRRFWVRRAFKILPPYFVFLAVVALLWLFDGQPSVFDCWPNLLHAQNYLGTADFSVWHTWSLAVEEHFYLLLPLVLLFLGSARRHWLPILFVFVAIECLVLRLGRVG